MESSCTRKPVAQREEPVPGVSFPSRSGVHCDTTFDAIPIAMMNAAMMRMTAKLMKNPLSLAAWRQSQPTSTDRTTCSRWG